MPFIFKPLKRYETKELIREIREISIQIACLKYDLQFALYLNHPSNMLEGFANELAEYKDAVIAEQEQKIKALFAENIEAENKARIAANFGDDFIAQPVHGEQ